MQLVRWRAGHVLVTQMFRLKTSRYKMSSGPDAENVTLQHVVELPGEAAWWILLRHVHILATVDQQESVLARFPRLAMHYRLFSPFPHL